jgi:hypothetical protein
MGHEISQFDIPDRQLLASSAQAGMWSDIGEAKITHTIFGRAKVRVIRERDKIIRAWLLAALAVLVISVAAWQGWIALQQSKLLAVLPPLSERISIGAPVFHPATIAPASRSSAGSKPESLIQSEIDSLVANPNRLPPRPPPLNAKPMDAKPVTAQPLMASKPQPVKPQTAPLATNSVSSINQTGTQPHPRKSAPIQPATPAVAAPPATQPAANRPAPVAPPAEPLSKKDTSATSLAGNNQSSDPVNAQPQANVQTQANAQTQVNARGTAIIFVQPQDNAQP